MANQWVSNTTEKVRNLRDLPPSLHHESSALSHDRRADGGVGIVGSTASSPMTCPKTTMVASANRLPIAMIEP